MTELLSFTLAFILAVCLCPAGRRVGVAFGVVDRPSPGDLKIHAQSVSLLGGVAVVLAALGSLEVVRAGLPLSIVAAVFTALGGGLVDDIRPLPPTPRVLVLAASGAILAFEIPTSQAVVLGAIGVILLVLACANAVNLLDGQDGLAGGLGMLSGLGLAAVSATLGADGAVVLPLALAGALGGFLVWNRPTARIFLGNGGAYAVGVMLAATVVLLTISAGWRGLVASGIVLGVFAFEACFTVARRLMSGDSLTRGDRLHSYDLLAMRLRSRTRSTVVFWTIALGTSALGLTIAWVPFTVGVLVAILIAVVASLFGIVLWKGRPTELPQSGPPSGGSA
jgi:UDP-GlcNAc:undecaprenyl-phosphate/decaprenyl-phosphate GlcNAc-1-phosphate transferase